MYTWLNKELYFIVNGVNICLNILSIFVESRCWGRLTHPLFQHFFCTQMHSSSKMIKQSAIKMRCVPFCPSSLQDNHVTSQHGGHFRKPGIFVSVRFVRRFLLGFSGIIIRDRRGVAKNQDHGCRMAMFITHWTKNKSDCTNLSQIHVSHITLLVREFLRLSR